MISAWSHIDKPDVPIPVPGLDGLYFRGEHFVYATPAAALNNGITLVWGGRLWYHIGEVATDVRAPHEDATTLAFTMGNTQTRATDDEFVMDGYKAGLAEGDYTAHSGTSIWKMGEQSNIVESDGTFLFAQ